MLTYVEPVDRAAVDERRILADVVAKGVSDWTECNDDVQVLAASTDEERKQFQWRQLTVVGRVLVRCCPDRLQQFSTFFNWNGTV